MGSEKYMENVSMSSAEKRYKPSKHYVYVLQVTWSDGTTFPVFRKYSEFYDLHLELMELFPREAGFGGERILPYLPGKKLLRAEVEKVAAKRKGPLEDYCRAMLKLEEYISRHELLIDFFRTRPEDINPQKDATKKPERSRLLAALGLFVPKFRRKGSKEGNSPTSPGYPDDIYVSGPVNFDSYYVIADYKAQAKREISLEEGTEVEVVEKNDNGWWFISVGTEQGWAPASFLEPMNTAQEIDEPEPIYNGEPYITLEAYEAELEDEISFPKDVIVEAIHKHLDGWWIISYEGKVGHAPATYLQEYSNPHFSPTALMNFKPKKVRPPTQRRCTIKNRHSKWEGKTDVILKRPDMATYRKMSVKIAANKTKARIPVETPTAQPRLPERKQPSLKEEDEDELYINNDDAVAIATRDVNKPNQAANRKPAPIPRMRAAGGAAAAAAVTVQEVYNFEVAVDSDDDDDYEVAGQCKKSAQFRRQASVSDSELEYDVIVEETLAKTANRSKDYVNMSSGQHAAPKLPPNSAQKQAAKTPVKAARMANNKAAQRTGHESGGNSAAFKLPNKPVSKPPIPAVVSRPNGFGANKADASNPFGVKLKKQIGKASDDRNQTKAAINNVLAQRIALFEK